LSKLINLIKSDLFRYTKSGSLKSFIKTYSLRGSFRYIFWVRINSIFIKKRSLKYTIFPITWVIWRRYSYKYGISIPYKTKIGYGFKINHFGGIIINSNSVIGNNVTICQGVTIGNNEIANDVECPIINDGVYIAPGAKVIGNITIGDNVVIGANSVVVKNVTSNKIVGGIPAKIIKDNPYSHVKNQYLLR
jgi:serine O-acetyltransferase